MTQRDPFLRSNSAEPGCSTMQIRTSNMSCSSYNFGQKCLTNLNNKVILGEDSSTRLPKQPCWERILLESPRLVAGFRDQTTHPPSQLLGVPSKLLTLQGGWIRRPKRFARMWTSETDENWKHLGSKSSRDKFFGCYCFSQLPTFQNTDCCARCKEFCHSKYPRWRFLAKKKHTINLWESSRRWCRCHGLHHIWHNLRRGHPT